MKKTIITIAAVVSGLVAAQAQGLVHFNNSNATLMSTNSAVGGAATGVTTGTFYYALFAAASGTTVGGSTAAVIPTSSGIGTYVWDASNAGSWTEVALGLNTATAGRFASTTADSNANTALNGLAAGTAYAMLVVGWSSSLGSTLSAMEAALASGSASGYVGESIVGTITPGNGTSIPSSAVFGTGAPFINGFTLGATPIPEPGTLALAALGGASLLLFRRKK